MRWRYAQVTVGQEETGCRKTEMLREADIAVEKLGSKDMTADAGSRRGRQEGPREREKRWRSVQRKQRDRSSGRSERRRTMRR